MKILMKLNTILTPVRNAPSMSGDVVEYLKLNDVIYTATRLVNGWYYLETIGWIHSSLLLCKKIIEPYDPDVDFTSFDISVTGKDNEVGGNTKNYNIIKIVDGVNKSCYKLATDSIKYLGTDGKEMTLTDKLNQLTLELERKFNVKWDDVKDKPDLPTADDLKIIRTIKPQIELMLKSIEENSFKLDDLQRKKSSIDWTDIVGRPNISQNDIKTLSGIKDTFSKLNSSLTELSKKVDDNLTTINFIKKTLSNTDAEHIGDIIIPHASQESVDEIKTSIKDIQTKLDDSVKRILQLEKPKKIEIKWNEIIGKPDFNEVVAKQNEMFNMITKLQQSAKEGLSKVENINTGAVLNVIKWEDIQDKPNIPSEEEFTQMKSAIGQIKKIQDDINKINTDNIDTKDLKDRVAVIEKSIKDADLIGMGNSLKTMESYLDQSYNKTATKSYVDTAITKVKTELEEQVKTIIPEVPDSTNDYDLKSIKGKLTWVADSK